MTCGKSTKFGSGNNRLTPENCSKENVWISNADMRMLVLRSLSNHTILFNGHARILRYDLEFSDAKELYAARPLAANARKSAKSSFPRSCVGTRLEGRSSVRGASAWLEIG
jgi:hypothetical protein